MVDVWKIERDVASLKKMTASDRIPARAKILGELRQAEEEIARDFTIPFDRVRHVRKLVEMVA